MDKKDSFFAQTMLNSVNGKLSVFASIENDHSSYLDFKGVFISNKYSSVMNGIYFNYDEYGIYNSQFHLCNYGDEKVKLDEIKSDIRDIKDTLHITHE